MAKRRKNIPLNFCVQRIKESRTYICNGTRVRKRQNFPFQMNYTFKILKTESPKITALEIRRTSTVVQAFGSHVEEKYTVVFISKKEEKT